jgi:hypothetical protein
VEEAERAERMLQDSDEFDEMVKPFEAHGISRDMLIDARLRRSAF